MHFNCGPTSEERAAWKSIRGYQKVNASIRWHCWFAWYPIRIAGTRKCVWFETVRRKFGYAHYSDVMHGCYRGLPEYSLFENQASEDR